LDVSDPIDKVKFGDGLTPKEIETTSHSEWYSALHTKPMRRFLILGPNAGFAPNDAYRGTEHRLTPSYHAELDHNHEVHQWFQWLIDAGGETGVVNDLENARLLVAAYANLMNGEEFEIIEAVDGEIDLSEAEGEFLGYDLSHKLGNSLLAGDVLLTVTREALDQDPELTTVAPILDLIERYFRPGLNANRLFQDYKTAIFCLECMKVVVSFCPGIFEHGEYEVVGLFRIAP
jgi:hypothetical protein